MDDKNVTRQPAAWIAEARTYIDGLQAEMRKVTWPTPRQVQSTTAVVIASVFLFAGYFAVVDALVGRGITLLFEKLAH